MFFFLLITAASILKSGVIMHEFYSSRIIYFV